MFPTPYVSAQRTVRAWATIGIVVFAAGSVVVGVVTLTGGGSPAAHHQYNVTFSETSENVTGSSGSAPMRTTTDVSVPIKGSNITEVIFHISWQDQSISPFTNPAVTGTVTGPNGTGTQTGRIATSGSNLNVTLPTAVPSNTTVEAGSSDEAVAKAAGSDLNATLGSGVWTVSLQVGSPLGPRPGGSISYSISVEVRFFVGKATLL